MTKEIECTKCDFMIRSEDEDEAVEAIQDHAKEAHQMSMSRSDAQQLWKTF